MRFSAFMLVACLSGAGTITIANTSFADKSGVAPETNLARGRFQRAVFNRDGTRLLTATAELAQLWDLNTGAMLQKFEGHAAYIHSICFSPDEQQVLTGAGKGVEHGRNDPSVRLWDASTGKLITVMTTVGKELVDEIGMSSAYQVMTARYSPNGQQALSVMSSSNGYPNAVVLWNLQTNDIDLVLSRISTASGTLVIGDPVQFSPDGKWLSGFVNEASQVVIWNAGTGAVRWRFSISDDAKQNENDSRFELTQWSPSGRFVLAASSDRTVNVWDVSNGGKIQRLQGHDGRIQFAAFFPMTRRYSPRPKTDPCDSGTRNPANS